MTATEANRNFTGLTKFVDSEGEVGIEKNGNLKYVVMTKERYDSMKREAFLGKRGEDFIKVEVNGERATVYSVWLEDEKLEHMVYTIIECPSDVIELTKKGRFLSITGDLDKRKGGEKVSVINAEAFLDENEKCVFLPENPTHEADIFEADCIRRCVEVVKEATAESLYEASISITRNGREQIEDYSESLKNAKLRDPGRRAIRTGK